MDVDDFAIQFGNVENLVNMDMLRDEPQEEKVNEAMGELTVKMKEISVGKAQKYKKYRYEQIARFIEMLQEEGLTVPKAAEICSIPRSTGYRLLNEFNASDSTVLPSNLAKPHTSRLKKLFPEHTAFFIQLFDNNLSIVLED
ncbi:hypothetical protein EC973_006484, partial [Apophysomyces ossiformis]